jgi:4'-phosphopantetheinyl transferase EntD
LFDRSVAFASARFEARPIQNSDATATVSDEALFLKGLCKQRHACSSDAKHFAKKLLRQLQLFSAGAVGTLQQPPRQNRLESLLDTAVAAVNRKVTSKFK